MISRSSFTQKYRIKIPQTNIIGYRLYMESKLLHRWTYLQNSNRVTDIECRLVGAKRGGLGVGISRC